MRDFGIALILREIKIYQKIYYKKKELNFNESIRDIRITLSCDDINKSFFVENFNARNLSNFQLRLNQDLYSKSILENTSYKEFIINALNYIKENNLENISVTYSFNLSFNSRDIVVEKPSVLTKELIKIAYEDIFKYKLEKHINTGDVINIEFSRYNNILFRGLFNNTYKIKAQDWNSGDNLWLVNVLCPKGGGSIALRRLDKLRKEDGLPNKVNFKRLGSKRVNNVERI